MIAIYLRLSLADGDISRKDESNSITNQRSLLREYISDHEDLACYPVREFTDDGYSGTNFDRPAFQEMMTMAKQGLIHTVIVKDFSRFGRDYIEIGDFIERIFPLLGVRFISLMEHYDSQILQGNDQNDLRLTMRNLMNTYYSRQLSQKVLSSVRAIADKGNYVYGARPYGYMQDPKDRHQIIPDPEAANVVRKIFELAADGKSAREICKILNDEEIPTRAEFFRNNKRKGVASTRHTNRGWIPTMISHTIRNPIYKGTFVSQLKKRVSYGHTELRNRHADEQVVIEHHHEPIISEEIFDKAQAIIPRRQAMIRLSHRYALKTKVVCGHCGYHMRFEDERYMTCSHNYKNVMDTCCTNEHYDYKELCSLVLRELKLWAGLLQITRSSLSAAERAAAKEHNEMEDKLRDYERELAQVQKRKLDLYEKYTEGVYVREQFQSLKHGLDAEAEQIQSHIDSLKRAKRGSLNKTVSPELQKLIDAAAPIDTAEELTYEMSETFVDRVVVYDREHIEIRWKMQDQIKNSRMN